MALARLVEVMRRTGNLEKIPEYLSKSEEYVGTRSSLEPGLNFCKGMYEWYAGNPNEALKLFNKARKDHEWGQRAIYNMIEICINPDNQMLGGEVFESVDNDVTADTKDSQEMALRTAEKLLRELKPKPGQQMMSFQLLQGLLQHLGLLCKVSSKQPFGLLQFRFTSLKVRLIRSNFSIFTLITFRHVTIGYQEQGKY